MYRQTSKITFSAILILFIFALTLPASLSAESQKQVWQSSSQTNSAGEILHPEIVQQVQRELKKLGYYFDTIDGKIGTNTRNGIKVYQHAQKMKKDGKITLTLLERMNISPIVSQPPPRQAVGKSKAEKDLKTLKKELRKLIKKIKKRNGADPWVIDRLEKLAGVSKDTWSKVLLNENFTKRNYQINTSWQVRNGAFHVESGKGLIGTPRNSWVNNDNQMDELALNLLDILISQGQQSQQVQNVARIEHGIHFSNSFSVRLKTGPLYSTEGLLLSCFQNGSSKRGYRLAIHPGRSNQAKLFTINGRSATEVPTTLYPVRFNRDRAHTFAWTRSPNGTITVTLDGQKLLETKSSSVPARSFNTLGITHIGERIVIEEVQLKES